VVGNPPHSLKFMEVTIMPEKKKKVTKKKEEKKEW
jgi:hypothetical protein